MCRVVLFATQLSVTDVDSWRGGVGIVGHMYRMTWQSALGQSATGPALLTVGGHMTWQSVALPKERSLALALALKLY